MTDLPSQPSLFGDPPGPARSRRPRVVAPGPVAHASRRLWLGVHLPGLPLEALACDRPDPLAVLDGAAGRAKILRANAAARARGIETGLSTNAALALVPELLLRPRDEQREARTLVKLAERALDFSPAVSLQPPDGLLLEIGGSLKLFGGASRLQQQLIDTLQMAGHRAGTAIAATGLASLWLARVAQGSCIETPEALPGMLAPLPLRGLGWPARLLQSLEEMGVRCLGDCVRLPREGLAKRLGVARLRLLDQAYGRAPEAWRWHTPRASFTQSIELPALTADLALLTRGLEILVQQLAEELRRRQRGVRHLWLRFAHQSADRPDSRLRIGLLEATASASRLMDLLRVKLAATPLPAAVHTLSLQAVLTEGPLQSVGDLLADGCHPGEPLPAFIERLRARLGENSVHGLYVLADHRPEYAWQAVSDPLLRTGSDAPRLSPAERPLWMLPEPLRLQHDELGAKFHGRLQLEQGPERIETGWWDGEDIRRDYYRARNARGMDLWIFHDLRGSGWYLHGLFG